MCFAASVISDIQVRLSIPLVWLVLGLIRYGHLDHVAIDKRKSSILPVLSSLALCCATSFNNIESLFLID